MLNNFLDRYVVLLANYNSVSLESRFPPRINFFCILFALISVLMAVGSAVGTLITDDIRVNSIRNASLFLCLLFAAITLEYAFIRLRNSIKRMYSDIYHDSSQTASRFGEQNSYKRFEKDVSSIQNTAGELSVVMSVSPDSKRMQWEPPSNSNELPGKSNPLEYTDLGAHLPSGPKGKSHSGSSKQSRKALNTAIKIKARLEIFVYAVPICCTLCLAALLWFFVSQAATPGKYSDYSNAGANNYSPLEDFSYYVAIIASALPQFYASVPLPVWFRNFVRCLLCCSYGRRSFDGQNQATY
mmetsp:Transcript_20604/g.50551  ORF Transcript_20604/g.50551 Transcript_20604/m.50551 type:complete len:299 (-) Transcript_20604:132-1028(-)